MESKDSPGGASVPGMIDTSGRLNDDGSVEIQRGKWSLQTGAHDGFEIERDISYDGQGTHYRVTGTASEWMRSGGSYDGYGYSAKSGESSTNQFEVTLPPPYRMDAAVVDPFDPQAMPTGTRIRFDSTRQANQESTIGLKYVELVDESSREQGHSVQIEKTGEHTVRVTAGPNSMFERYGALGIPLLAGITPEIGRRDSLSHESVRSAEFDLSTPEGREAYGRIMDSGTFPEHDAPGISNVLTRDGLGAQSQPGIRVPLPGTDQAFELSLEGSRGEGSITRRGDGSTEVRNARSYDNGVPLVEAERIGADGSSSKTYRFDFTPDNPATALQLNQAFSEDPLHPAKDLFAQGQTTSVTFSREEMQALLDMSRQALQNNSQAAGIRTMIEHVRTPDDLAEIMMRRFNGGIEVPGMLASVAQFAGDDRDPRTFDRLPGTVEPAGQLQQDAAAGSGRPTADDRPDAVSLASDRHPDNPLFAAIRDKAPADIGDDHIALVTRQAKQAGITVDNLEHVLRGPNDADQLWVTGSPPVSLRTSIDLAEPAPSIDRTSEELARDAAQVGEQQQQASLVR